MTPSGILILYLVFFGVEFLFENTLSLLNNRNTRGHRNEVPEAFRGAIDPKQYEKSCSYSLARGRFAITAGFVSSVIVLIVVLSGFLGVVDNWVAGLRLAAGLKGVVLVAVIAGLFHLLSMPASIFSQFVIEERFGFNTMTAKTFLFDEVKGFLLSAVLGVPILLGLFWFVRSAGELWWILAFLAITAFQLVITVIYPMMIAPLFNKFTPLEEGSLRTRIGLLADELSFATSGIFVMDGSRRSRHSNAYFTGIGKTKRIVLFDTLVDKLTEEQILAVLAHEIGHQKKMHIVQRLVVSLVLTLGALWLIDLLLGWESLFGAFGFDRPCIQGLLVILSFCSGPFTFMLTPIFTSWSRHHEYQADRFASENGGRAGDLKGALITLGRDNLSNLSPHRLYSFFHYSHPTLSERVAFLSSLEESIG
jgi:STE24 endopeptidase